MNGNGCLIRKYEGVVITDSCEFVGNAVIGQDTYCDQSSFSDGVQLNRRNIIVDATFGRRTYTGANTTVKHADVGAFCSISWNVSIGGAQHDYKKASTHPFTELPSFGFVDQTTAIALRTVVGNDVWIGCGSTVLAGVRIGNGAVVGGGSVVSKDVPPYSIVAGNPARCLKRRFSDDEIELLEEAQWWEWDDDRIREQLPLFQQRLTREIAEQIARAT